MLCSNCGKDIPFTGDVCPYCKTDKSKDQRIHAFAMLFAISGCLIGYFFGGFFKSILAGVVFGIIGMIIAMVTKKPEIKDKP
jgi:hypothetical protein